MTIIYDNTIKEWVIRRNFHRRALVGIDSSILEFGYISDSIRCPVAKISGEVMFLCIDDQMLKDYFVFSEKIGFYLLKTESNPDDTKIIGSGGFPYTFTKQYESLFNLELFRDKQLIENNYKYWASKYLYDYTFGFEFETSCGYVPQHECFKSGLIPLRDGSITGLEYTSVVLQGNDGLNMLHQELEQLKAHCKFDKECSLHIHIGGYPVNDRYLWVLYNVFLAFENKIKKFLPKWTFETRRYKASGKDYCKKLWGDVINFNQLYRNIAGSNYFGDLHQNHPDDPFREHKWNVHSRYYWVNLVNMMCYSGPKTIEFRFLRPSFDEKKIVHWLILLISLLEYSKKIAEKAIKLEDVASFVEKDFTLIKLINKQFGKKHASEMKKFLIDLKNAVAIQTDSDDLWGSLYQIENYDNLTL